MRVLWAAVPSLWAVVPPTRVAMAPIACALPPFAEEINLIYDGECAVCQWERDNLLSLGAKGRIRFTDLESPAGYDETRPENGDVSYEAAMSRITAVTREGEVITGMRVFAECYSRVGLGWAFAPLDWPVVGPLVERAYEAFAVVRTDITRGRRLQSLVEQHNARSGRFDWRGFERHAIGGLKRPLLVAVGTRGYAACGYIDVATADKLEEACVIFTGVDTCDDFLDADVQRVSEAATALGVRVGMQGDEALELLR